VRILLTNDDGIRAPGIMAMYDALVLGTPEHPGPLGGEGSTVTVVAPLTVQSATSHGITFHEPLMVRDEPLRLAGERGPAPGVGVAVDGRPADCVKLAVSAVFPERFGNAVRPDLIVSGINAGANCGINVIYSGTVAAAIEGAFLGIPSVAISLRLSRNRPRFDIAAARARRVLEVILAAGGPGGGEVLNINLPATSGVDEPGHDHESVKRGRPGSGDQALRIDSVGHSDPGEMPPVRVCPMNTHGLVDKYERRVSPSGDTYYWAAGHGLDFHATEPGSDVDLLMQGCITITPLGFDLTKRERLAGWRTAIGR
jgi:5'-nucleotidase